MAYHDSPNARVSSSNDVIGAMVSRNASNDGLRSRNRLTAGPTGSSPAAPGWSAYAPWKAK
jgi:hypothetical protein